MVIAIGFTGCLKEDMDTIALPVGKIPQNVIPDDIRNRLENYIDIYEGDNPPDITGEYIVYPNMLVYDSENSWDYEYMGATQLLSFKKQTSSGEVTYMELDVFNNGYSLIDETEMHVVGSGNNLTAYMITETKASDNSGNITSSSKKAVIISGTVTEAGIKNFQYAFVMLDKYDPNNTLMDINEYRVFKDGDGVAERYEWTNMLYEEKKQMPICTGNSLTYKMK